MPMHTSVRVRILESEEDNKLSRYCMYPTSSDMESIATHLTISSDSC